MGMYTGLKLTAYLDLDKMSDNEYRALMFIMCGFSLKDITFDLPNHEFFREYKNRGIIRSDGGLADFQPRSYFRDDMLYLRFNCKNYDDAIENLLDWLSPFVIGFKGLMQYEEWHFPVKLIRDENGIITCDRSSIVDDYTNP